MGNVQDWLVCLDQCIQSTWLSAKRIGYHISLSGVIMDSNIIILYQLNPSSLPHIQLLLRENVLQALVICEDLAAITHKIMTPRHASLRRQA